MQINMNNSRIDTIQVPSLGTSNPATLAVATLVPMRLMIRNIGTTVVFLAHNSTELAQVGFTAGTYQLPPGGADIFVLAPRQGMWATATGLGGTVSIALSEAMPTFWNES